MMVPNEQFAKFLKRELWLLTGHIGQLQGTAAVGPPVPPLLPPDPVAITL